MYNIVLDKSKTFECNVDIQGASMDNSKVRLVLELADYSLFFDGTVGKGGDVKIPITKLKNILKEGVQGNIFLEVVVDDTLFTPWSSEYKTEVAQKVEVTFDKPKPVLEEKKVKVTVGNILDSITPVNILANSLIKEGVNINNLKQKPKSFNRILEAFVKDYKLNTRDLAQVLKDLPEVLYEFSK